MGNIHLQGIIPPMITPLRDMNSLDIPGLEKLVEHILSGGVQGLFILGTTGEAQSLSYELRHELIERVCRQVGKRVPVLVGISDTSLVESLHLAEKAFAEGATAVVSAPPYYYAPAQQELIDFYQGLADVLPLPLFLYNMPSHVKVKIEPVTLKAVAEHPNVIGLKDSSADMVYFHSLIQVMKDKPDFSLLVGPEELTAEAVLLGADGGVNGGANMFPSLYVKMYKAAKSRDLDTVMALQQQIMYISNSIYKIGKYGSSYLKGVKCACSLLGLCSDYMALPFQRFNAPERKRVQQILETLGYTVVHP
ncbi:MAG: dihydrodipicolinate synthase family protein [Bacteroidales bacterium]|nr:dihydrodipicolinate synthase family protein [Bacteroidales bacterium]MDD4431424.1 dihydrodipicolinate synthase family protein [Bacteroidales bacterium]